MSTTEPVDTSEATDVYPKYDEYKDSGVEWLGEIPAHWEVVRSEAFLRRKRNSVSSEDLDEREVFHYSIPVIDETGDGQVEDGTEIGSSKTQLSGGELLVSKLNPRKSRVLLGEPKDRLSVCSNEFVVMEPDGCDPRFAKYLYSAEHVRQYLDSMVQSATRSHQRANPDDITKMKAGWPSPDEQRAIATFLDRETGRIDALIEKKEELIDLLEEKRTALISRVVTKGLDPDVETQDSGVEWLGEIPAHWDVVKLKFISPNQSVGVVQNPSSYFDPEGEIPFILGNNISEREIDVSEAPRISEESNQELQGSMLRTGDLVVVRVGDPGVSAVVPPELDKSNCGSVLIVRGDESFDSEWLGFAMNSDVGAVQIDLVEYGAAQRQFNLGHAVNFCFPLPPKEEQQQISEYLEHRTEQLYDLIDIISKGIERLEEYRTALISAAVTGQIDVRKEVGMAPVE